MSVVAFTNIIPLNSSSLDQNIDNTNVGLFLLQHPNR